MTRRTIWAVLVSALGVLTAALVLGRSTVTDAQPSFGDASVTSARVGSVNDGDGPTTSTSRMPRTGNNDSGDGFRPVQVSLPSLGLKAEVVPVGVTPEGVMVIPEDGDRVGWYRFGPRAGSTTGSVVLVGHRDTRAEGPGALFDLDQVSRGDTVTLTGPDGGRVAYRITSLESLPKQQLPVDRLFVRDGRPHLTLVTCGGPYLPELGGYQDNIVVTAVPVRGS
ncbi:MAG: class F sortase [Actinomycetes bacterium]